MYFYSVVCALIIAGICVSAQEIANQKNNEKPNVDRPAEPAYSGHQIKTRPTTEARKVALRKLRDLMHRHLSLKPLPLNGSKQQEVTPSSPVEEERQKRGALLHHLGGHGGGVGHGVGHVGQAYDYCEPEYIEYEYCYYPQNPCY